VARECKVHISGRQPSASRPDRQPDPSRVLSLNGQETLDHIDGIAGFGSGQHLGGKAPPVHDFADVYPRLLASFGRIPLAVSVGRAGFEPAARGLKAPCSNRAELPAPWRF
jgi:hypothetical protein